LIDEFSQNPETISVKTGNTSDAVEQDVVKYRDIREKIEKLHNVLVGTQKAKFIIFEETKRGTDALARELVSRGFRAESMHGDKTLGERRRALERFKQNKSNILVATDVAARGIDVADITHVINYSTPQNYDDYVHRIGRAGRAGRTGFALTFVQTR
jgi:ATP-dependent RNA helicase RhlE